MIELAEIELAEIELPIELQVFSFLSWEQFRKKLDKFLIQKHFDASS